jgi:ubiquitin-like protein Pup
MRIKKQPAEKKQEQPEVETAAQKTAEEIKAETDALLDEIDELLEVNAEDFIKAYVQKGGE